MTLPRELTLRRAAGGWTLYQHPARELWTALSRKIDAERTSLIASQRQVLCQERTGALRARLQMEPGSLVEFELFANGENKTVIGYDAARAVLYFDRRKSGGPAVHEKFPVRREAALPLPSAGTLDFQVIWDRSTVEVFAGDGAVYLSGLTFPAPEATEVAVHCRIGRVALERLDVQAEP
jgi:sucrose-6-phosphate hydrolase SacC (GH32 family)